MGFPLIYVEAEQVNLTLWFSALQIAGSVFSTHFFESLSVIRRQHSGSLSSDSSVLKRGEVQLA